MSVASWEELKKEGYVLHSELEAALPMQVWVLDLEIERLRVVSAAELTVLRLLQVGVLEVPGITEAMGLGEDARLAERVLVKLLSAGAIETQGEGFALTPAGGDWIGEGSAYARERVTAEVRLDPVLDTFEWMDSERSVFASPDTWTVDLPKIDDETVLRRRTEIGDLLRSTGLPDEDEKAPTERRGATDLRGVAILSRRVHWRAVKVEVMKHPLRRELKLVGSIGDAENPPLSELLAGHEVLSDRKRLAAVRQD